MGRVNSIDNIILKYIPKNTTCQRDERKREYLRMKEKNEILQFVEKVENPLQVSIQSRWQQQRPDMSFCRTCKETIFGTQFKLVISVNAEVIEQSRPVILCENCYKKNG